MTWHKAITCAQTWCVVKLCPWMWCHMFVSAPIVTWHKAMMCAQTWCVKLCPWMWCHVCECSYYDMRQSHDVCTNMMCSKVVPLYDMSYLNIHIHILHLPKPFYCSDVHTSRLLVSVITDWYLQCLIIVIHSFLSGHVTDLNSVMSYSYIVQLIFKELCNFFFKM